MTRWRAELVARDLEDRNRSVVRVLLYVRRGGLGRDDEYHAGTVHIGRADAAAFVSMVNADVAGIARPATDSLAGHAPSAWQ